MQTNSFQFNASKKRITVIILRTTPAMGTSHSLRGIKVARAKISNMRADLLRMQILTMGGALPVKWELTVLQTNARGLTTERH